MQNYRPIGVFLLFCLPTVAFADGDPEELIEPQTAAAQPAATRVQDPVAIRVQNRTADTPIAIGQRQQPVNTSSEKTIEVYASDETFEALYEVQGPVLGLKSDRARASYLISEERDNVVAGSILYDTNLDIFPGLSVSFGAKVYAGLLGPENNDVFGLAGGVEAAYLFPVRQFPLQLSAAANFSPDILTFGQADRIIDWHVRAGLPLTDNIDGFVGFRFLQFEDTLPGDREVDDRLHIGVRWALGK